MCDTSLFFSSLADEVEEQQKAPRLIARMDTALKIITWLNAESNGEATELSTKYKQFCDMNPE